MAGWLRAVSCGWGSVGWHGSEARVAAKEWAESQGVQQLGGAAALADPLGLLPVSCCR